MATTTFELKGDQPQAMEKLCHWFDTKSKKFCILNGPAGTGKTTLLRAFKDYVRGRTIFTAPTNKATRVLRQTLTTPDYRPECRTIYSVLGLRLEANGELKELKASEDDVDLSRFKLIVIDEGSMIPPTLLNHLSGALKGLDILVLILGDPYQLPPVGLPASPIWKMPEAGFAEEVTLSRILRHDNTILNTVTEIRAQIDRMFPAIKIVTSYDATGGVKKMADREFRAAIWEAAEAGRFVGSSPEKIVAWRNVTVMEANNLVRTAIYNNQESANALPYWLPGDRLVVTEPAKDFADEPVASTDDEGSVRRVEVHPHPMYEEYKCWVIDAILDTNEVVTFWALHPSSQQAWAMKKQELANEARNHPRRWKDYWGFIEKFHQVRHGYAITAHRSQGSTYQTVYVNSLDILVNQNRKEAFQCLYVACSRASLNLNVM